MDADRWRRAKELLRAALEQPASAQAAFVEHCDPDETVRAEVARLLKLCHQTGEFLRSPLETHPPPEDAIDPLIGRRLGEFELVRRVGAGGMGVVYEALQSHPSRRAAVKMVRPGFATPALLRRFEYESEILARLHHPGIAHVYASGTHRSAEGPQPWFAMEFVEGLALHEYARRHAPAPRQALELLLQICDAVQHAHQRGVVHRDLKPGNIIVAASNTDAPPKVLDFGVARLMDADLQATMHTVAGELVGTLNYMSPEQVAGRGDDIDARCDVFALGVIGFELLAGILPHDRASGRLTDVLRRIEFEEPRRLGAHCPALRGDVETIFDKALARDPERRYASAGELAADIRRWLSSEPILARPPSRLYHVRMFARRHRALVFGVAATMLALSAGIVLYAGEARRAREEAERSRYEADKAMAINNFMTNDFLMKVLAAANERGGEERLPVVALVDRAAEPIAAMFKEQPLAEAAVRNEVASIYYNLGAFVKAAEQFQAALTGWESRLGPDHPDTLKAVNNLGQTLMNLGRRDEAEPLYRRALDGRMRALGIENHFTLVSLNNLAECLRARGELNEAEALHRQALAVQQRVLGESHKTTLTTMNNLGSLLGQRGDVAGALSLHRRVSVVSHEVLGPDHVMTLVADSRLGATLCLADQPAEAEALLTHTLASLERTLGPTHNSALHVRRTLARALGQLGRRDEAVAQLQQALQTARAHPEVSSRLRQDLINDLEKLQPAAPAASSAAASGL